MMRIIGRVTKMRNKTKLNRADRRIAKSIFEQCFAVRRGESMLIIADKKKLPIARLLFSVASLYSKDVRMLVFDGMTENGQEPCAEVSQAMLNFDVQLLVTNFSLSHTSARMKASETGARIASLPGITLDMMRRTMDVDFAKIRRASNRLAKKLTTSSRVTITAVGGTKLTMSLAGRTAEADTGDLTKKGAFGNLPAGEAFLAPVEGTAEGVLVIDGSLADILLDKPVRITIRKGVAVKIEGGRAARELEKAMNALGNKARVVAEFGIGTNPKAIVQPDVLEAEKAANTIHVAFGYNADFGGTNEVEFHSDGVVLRPSIQFE